MDRERRRIFPMFRAPDLRVPNAFLASTFEALLPTFFTVN
jgi:hypothetical protein